MAVHRFWRLYVTSCWAQPTPVITGLELRETAAGANLSVAGNGTPTGQFKNPQNAFDLDTATEYYFGGGLPSWVAWDFGAGIAKEILHITIVNNAYTGYNVKDAQFQHSDDGATYTTVFAISNPDNFSARNGYEYVPPASVTVSLTPPAPKALAYGGGHGAIRPAAAVLAGFAGGWAAAIVPAASLSSAGGAFLALTGTFPTLYATGHDSSGERAARLTAPPPALSANGGSNARLTGPSPALSITATITGWGRAALAPPMSTLAAAGTVSAMADATLSAPMAGLIGYSGAVCSITGAAGSLQASGTTGAIGSAALTCPLFVLTASGTAQGYGSANLLAPAARLGATAQAWLMAPAGRLTAIGTAVVAAAYEAYSINLTHSAKVRPGVEPVDEVTHYTNFPFTHVVRFQGSYFGAAADGLYLLEGTTDDGEAIDYAVKTCTDDFGVAEKKTVASACFGGRLGPEATITLAAGETGAESYAFTTPRGQAAQNHREKFGRGVKNRYFAVGVAGDGALELDTLDLDLQKLTRRI